MLIANGADPQTETKFGETALQMAIVAEDPTAIMTLIKCKAEVDHVTSRGMTISCVTSNCEALSPGEMHSR